jgi:hypothetical protein
MTAFRKLEKLFINQRYELETLKCCWSISVEVFLSARWYRLRPRRVCSLNTVAGYHCVHVSIKRQWPGPD